MKGLVVVASPKYKVGGGGSGVKGLGGLTLGLHPGDQFCIDGKITIIVQPNMRVGSKQILLRVIAPRDMKIEREGYDASSSKVVQ